MLAVQEVDRNQSRSARLDQAAFVAEVLGAVWYRHVDTVSGTPGAHRWRLGADPGGDGPALPGPAGYGISLVSRVPVRDSRVLRLETARHRYPAVVPWPRPRLLWVPDEPRAAVCARLVEPGLTVACAHLSVLPATSVRQLVQVTGWLRGVPGPCLLLGDLNMPRTVARRVTGWAPLLSAATFPARRPRVQFDNVLATGLPPGTRVVGRAVLLSISDHRAGVVDLHLPD